MRILRTAVAWSLVLLWLAPGSPVVASQQTSGTEVGALLAAMTTITNALRAGDEETFLAGYTDDLFFMSENSTPVIGKAAYTEQTNFGGQSREWVETYVGVMVNGDWGHIIGDWTSGDRSGKAIYMFARQDDGSWKISHEFVNSNGAPEESR
ncbi:MAG TPA: DUF4440 domain-containing protein [Acidobacteriota bacterium]|nr:DUF4440 domain-containing protein [Acidobacteriota bacterium]